MSEKQRLHELVLAQFLTNLRNGGIEACRAMVRDLAVEAGMTDAVADGADTVQHESLEDQGDLSLVELVVRVDAAHTFGVAAIQAQAKYYFADFLLRTIERAA